MKRIPARYTVAGVANFKFLISKISLICGFKTIRSFDASVKSLLSSMTEFIDSIQFASRSPSSAIHFGLLSVSSDNMRILLDINPSFQSRVLGSQTPYNSLVETTFGFKSTSVVFLLSRVFALASVFQVVDLPAPGLPIVNTQCLISKSSPNSTTFLMNYSSGKSLDSIVAFLIVSSKAIFLLRSTSMPGNKSPSKSKKIYQSSYTILGVLKSRRALSKIPSSG